MTVQTCEHAQNKQQRFSAGTTFIGVVFAAAMLPAAVIGVSAYRYHNTIQGKKAAGHFAAAESTSLPARKHHNRTVWTDCRLL